MKNSKLTIDKINKLRPDFKEIDIPDAMYKSILDGTLSPYHVGNFLFLLNTPHGYRRKYESKKSIVPLVDDVAGEMGIDLSKYDDKRYFSTHEAHERSFPVYMKVHIKHGVPYRELIFG